MEATLFNPLGTLGWVDASPTPRSFHDYYDNEGGAMGIH